ncbi:MAG: hypothetical protein HY482_02105 [Candidatus Wildermuthbacteria bacterium]|nr:hypothetical protein [Candidatus Wildermuthbacteria bacterium]
MEQTPQKFFSKDAFRGVALAIIAVVIGQVVLAWQYYRLEEKRLPKIEQELKEQARHLEKESARKAVTSFLDAWIQDNAALATRFLTENAVFQQEQGAFSLGTELSSYKVLSLDLAGQGEFRAQIELYEQEGLPPQTQVLRVLKILDLYYIDSVEMAG